MAVLKKKLAALALFERVPDRIFRPLASENRQGYWSLLCDLYRRRFGPDAPLPPSHGYLQRDIVRDIESYLDTAPSWELEEDDTPETSLNGRANNRFNRLMDAGWLRVERSGLDKTINMPPAVSQLLTLLVTFAEQGPVFVSGKILSIDGLVARALDGDGSGAALSEAASQCRNLLIYIRNTGTSVRELMTILAKQDTTAGYVHGFFRDYIQQVFIGDYTALRTRDHPLQRHQQILDAVETLSSKAEHRRKLLAWYQSNVSEDATEAQLAMERDFQRLRELDRIEEYLGRLDDEVSSANRRAVAHLEYKIRSIRPIDNLLRQAFDGLRDLDDESVPAGMPGVFGVEPLIGPNRLVDPPRQTERQPPSKLRKAVISDRTIAIGNLARRAQERRSTTPIKLRGYAAAALAAADTGKVCSANLPAGTIEDARAFQALNTAAMAANSGIGRLAQEARVMAPGLELTYVDGNDLKNIHLQARAIEVSWRKKPPTSTGEKK